MEYVGFTMALLMLALIGWAVNSLVLRIDPTRMFKRAGKAMLRMGNRIATLGERATKTTAAMVKLSAAARLAQIDEESGYDWLIQEDESTGSADCGCTITRGSERFGDESILFKYCDMHRSAGKALEALERMSNEFDNNGLPMTSLPGYAKTAIANARANK